ncbi:MAG: ABC transporter substrate-binding protein [Candidatus Woesearchaeota archaeon]
MAGDKEIALRRQITLVVLLAVVIFLSGCTSPETPKVYHVGILSGAEPFTPIADGFKAKMTELGYIEGKDIVYDFQKFNADPEGEKRALKKFVDDKVDLIFAFPSEPAVEAKAVAQGTGIPVVFAQTGVDMNNLIESVQRPGGNITGVRGPALVDDTANRLEILHELVPQAKRFYLIYDLNYPNTPPALEGARLAASSLGITLVQDSVSNLEELQADLKVRAEAKDIGIDAILMMPDTLTPSPDGFAAIMKFAKEHKIPVGGTLNFMTDLGAICNYAPDMAEQGRMAAVIADKIFKGTPAGTIPVVTPENYLRINYKVAQELGLNVSEGLLSRAKEIIR